MMRRLPLLVAVSVACGGEGTNRGETYTRTDSAGIRIVESHAPAWSGAGRRIEPEPLLRIGQREGEEPYELGRISGLVLLARGRIAVSDHLANEIRVFDSAGRHVRTLGREGEGPGEFRSLIGIWAYRGDSIAAFDQRLYRTTVLSLETGLGRIVSNPVEGNFVVFGLLRNGPFLLFNPGQRRDLAPGLQWDSTDVVATTLAGDSSKVVTRLQVLERMIGPGGRRQQLTPFDVSVQAVAEDGFYWATSDEYEIDFYDAAGTRRRIIRRQVEPRPVDESMIAEYKAGFLEWVRGFEGDAAVPRYERRFEEGAFGETVPLFSDAFVDGDQRLWVSASPWPAFPGISRHWSVFSPDGVWLGDLHAPERLRIMDSRGDTVLGVWWDEMDVQHVQLHRLGRG